MSNIWEAISSAISSFTSAMVTGVKAFIELFYTTTGEASQQGFTILGYSAIVYGSLFEPFAIVYNDLTGKKYDISVSLSATGSADHCEADILFVLIPFRPDSLMASCHVGQKP